MLDAVATDPEPTPMARVFDHVYLTMDAALWSFGSAPRKYCAGFCASAAVFTRRRA
jgi:hypothetical protein